MFTIYFKFKKKSFKISQNDILNICNTVYARFHLSSFHLFYYCVFTLKNQYFKASNGIKWLISSAWFSFTCNSNWVNGKNMSVLSKFTIYYQQLMSHTQSIPTNNQFSLKPHKITINFWLNSIENIDIKHWIPLDLISEILS